MLGDFTLEGIEYIESFERRALVEHRVPGLAGSYFQDLGSSANAILVAGTRHGDDPRDTFLEGIRGIFNKGEPTTFVADINTATDVADVVVEDLHVAEANDRGDSFRYVFRLRKYVKPPEPAISGLDDLAAGIDDAASTLVGALDTLDALTSLPSFGDPTTPLQGALGGVTSATSDLPASMDQLGTLFGDGTSGPLAEMPTSTELGRTLGGLSGSEDGTGLAGAAQALGDASAAGRTTVPVDQLDAALAGAKPQGGGQVGDAAEQLAGVAGALPADPSTLVAPVTDRLASVQRLVSTETLATLSSTTEQLSGLRSDLEDPAALVTGTGLDRLAQSLGTGELSGMRRWAEGITELDHALALVGAGGALAVREALVQYFEHTATELVGLVVPGGRGPADALAAALDAALSTAGVASIEARRAALIAQLDTIRTELGAGQVPTTADAERSLSDLADELERAASGVREAVVLPAATADGLDSSLRRVYDDFRAVPMTDLARFSEELREALGSLQAGIAEVDLASVGRTVDEAWGRLTGELDALGLGRLSETLDEAEGAAREALDGLDAALVEVVALVRSALRGARDALTAVRDALGSTGPDGVYRLDVQRELEELIARLDTALRETVLPTLESFRSSVSETLEQVRGILESVAGEIESARAALGEGLTAAVDELREADVPGTMTRLRDSLDEVLDQLGEVDFDIVVDPVVAEIDEMRDELSKIDTSDLNEILKTALRTALDLFRSIDFTNEISKALLTELDELIEQPAAAVEEAQSRLAEVLARLDVLTPAAALEPLSHAFAPVREALDALDIDVVAAPLREWRDRALAELDAVSPAALLQPVVDLYAEMTRTLDGISTDRVVEVLHEGLAAIAGELQRVDPGALANQLGEAMEQARAVVDSLAPERIIAPLAVEYDRLTAAFERFDPAQLREPIERIFTTATDPLRELSDADVARVATAFEPLVALPAALDPAGNVTTAGRAIATTRALMDRLAVPQLLMDLAASQRAAVLAADEAGPPAADVAIRLRALDPLDDDDLTRAVTALREARSGLDAVALPATAAADLVAAYEAVRPDIERLIPDWVRPTPTTESLLAALAWADPASLTEDLGAIHAEILEQWRALDPRSLAAGATDIHERVLADLAALDPEAIGNRIRGLRDDVIARLENVNVDGVGRDLRELEADLREVVQALDPAQVLEALEPLVATVRGQLESLDPVAMLEELRPAFEAAKDAVRSFDPASFEDALRPLFDEIHEILASIDIRVVVEPLMERLRALRPALEDALRRTETAFDRMIAAVPL